MSNLFSTLRTTSEALQAFQTALEVTQNNVSNASTPGYARQVPTLEAQAFQPLQGLIGGVQAGTPTSTRSEYLEEGVRYQNELQGQYDAQSQALGQIEGLFDVTGQSGLAGALNNLFLSFSSWSTTPESAPARQDVLAKAQNFAASVQQTFYALSKISDSTDQQIRSTVGQINTLAQQIRDANVAIRSSQQGDAGADARLHTALESLSGLVGITTRFEADGTATVLLGGQTPLVIGDHASTISASSFDTGTPAYSGATPAAHILDVNGQDITALASQGTLGGLLTIRNTTLPSLRGDSQQAGSLNDLVKHVADRVNQILASGQTSGGQPGLPLFTYDTSSDVRAGATLAVNSAITASDLAPVDPGPPSVSNGIALQLAGLGQSRQTADLLSGSSILEYYGSLAASVGAQAASATDQQQVATQALAQARSLRNNVSGVSLDQEAIQVLELQRGYQAASKLISVLDSLTETLINMVP